MMQKFTWFVDMNTSSTAVQFIKVTAGGDAVKNRLAPFFGAYKYFKLGPVSVKFVPASTLPVDPTGLSLEAGANTVDPRDQFNPGLIRITNGEDMVDDMPGWTGGTTDIEKMYYSMMLDRRWYKFQLQAGVRRTARPLFWSIAQLKQDMFPGSIRNIPNVQYSSYPHTVTLKTQYDNTNNVFDKQITENSSPRGLFQTGVHERMSWLPTDYFQNFIQFSDMNRTYAGTNAVPEVELMKIVLPKAYKTKYYYRVYITETVYFKDPVVLNYNNFAPGDRFVTAAVPAGAMPGQSQGAMYNQANVIYPHNHGGDSL